jgi:hypothetical protein
MEGVKVSVNVYMSMKMELIKKLYDYDTKMLMEDIDLKKPMFRGLYNFHLVVSGGGNNELRGAKKLIEKVLAK